MEAELESSGVSMQGLTWYWKPFIHSTCCYTHHWHVIPTMVYANHPQYGNGWWYVVSMPWSNSYQIVDIVHCQTGQCKNPKGCQKEYHAQSLLISTFPITTIWQYIWGLATGNVWFTTIKVASGCYCPNFFLSVDMA